MFTSMMSTLIFKNIYIAFESHKSNKLDPMCSLGNLSISFKNNKKTTFVGKCIILNEISGENYM